LNLFAAKVTTARLYYRKVYYTSAGLLASDNLWAPVPGIINILFIVLSLSNMVRSHIYSWWAADSWFHLSL